MRRLLFWQDYQFMTRSKKKWRNLGLFLKLSIYSQLYISNLLYARSMKTFLNVLKKIKMFFLIFLYKTVLVVVGITVTHFNLKLQFGTLFCCDINLQPQSQTPWLNYSIFVTHILGPFWFCFVKQILIFLGIKVANCCRQVL